MLTVLLLVYAAASVFAAPARGDWSGGHDVMGSEGASRTWFFAEGCSRDGFDTWLCLQNPTGEQAVCDIHYYCGDGAVEARTGITLEPHSRATIPVHEPGLGLGRANNPHGDFSIAVFSTNGLPIVAERPMYFRYAGSITGGHNVMGAEAPRDEWFFAEGCSRDGFDTWLCLQNPTGEQAVCDIHYYCGDGAVEARTGIELEPHSRATIPVHEPGLGLGRANNPHGDFSIAVFSTNGQPIVAERPMYFRYAGSITGGHNVMGAEAPRKSGSSPRAAPATASTPGCACRTPRTSQAICDIHYYCGDGAVEARTGIDPGAPLPRDHPRARARPGPGTRQQPPRRFLHRRLLDQRPAHRGRAPHVLPLRGERDRRTRRHGSGGATRPSGSSPRAARATVSTPGCACRTPRPTPSAISATTAATGRCRRGGHPGAPLRATIPAHEPGLGLGRDNNPTATSPSPSSDQRRPSWPSAPMYFRYRSSLPEWRSVDPRPASTLAGAHGDIQRRHLAQAHRPHLRRGG